MARITTLSLTVLALLGATAGAQPALHHGAHHGAHPGAHDHASPRHAPPGGPAAPDIDAAGPYAGLEGRRIKALSDTAIADLLAGRGMAMALAAELNGHPGPMHVLEHAGALRLTATQRAAAERLRDRMLEEARTLGARIVAAEEELDRLFASGTADAGRLAALTASLGALAGRLREVHLAAHIAMHDALLPEQRAVYARLRGYAGPR
jgi:Spy/CpxP family protein refolding chaperone